MPFNAIEKREKERQPTNRREKKALAELDQINRIYPVHGYTDDGYVITKVLGFIDGFIEILKLRQYDLYKLDSMQYDTLTSGQWNLNKLYVPPLKEVYLNFPEDNQDQQNYWKYKIEHTTDPNRLRIQQFELEKLSYIEKKHRMRNVYLFVFGKTIEELKTRLQDLERFKDHLGQEALSLRDKKRVLFSFNNQL
ncbi:MULTISPECIES: hypothetical protein [unclassified Sporolactobacillus]|uniref:hypothetical protein n=1 Tax=unclassified Sporolactobacillus TaxID=2628533 RepID=UPI00236822B5|nr:hypothetical protein [Sporolactobacillus sp. CQH2019]MDD9150449.1 hypothetical protein [Sporolactobacillus sp. CQH2019]